MRQYKGLSEDKLCISRKKKDKNERKSAGAEKDDRTSNFIISTSNMLYNIGKDIWQSYRLHSEIINLPLKANIGVIFQKTKFKSFKKIMIHIEHWKNHLDLA